MYSSEAIQWLEKFIFIIYVTLGLTRYCLHYTRTTRSHNQELGGKIPTSDHHYRSILYPKYEQEGVELRRTDFQFFNSIIEGIYNNSKTSNKKKVISRHKSLIPNNEQRKSKLLKVKRIRDF